MKETMMIVAPLCLFLCWMLPVHSMTLRFNFTGQDAKIFPLDMAEHSVDDMYFGCSKEMVKKVKQKYIEGEKRTQQFAGAWNEAEKCAKNKLIHKVDAELTLDHLQAICLYTAYDVYQTFNSEVRGKGSFYGSSSLEDHGQRFQFHSLHFLLTSAIQILNSNYYCHTTYRRTSVRLAGKVNQIVRFGAFASSSYRTDLKMFGHESCFKIKTCLGAYLKKYSSFRDAEAEVLIPPYEVFKITEIMSGQIEIQGLGDCKVVFVLESAGSKSKLNCKLFQP